MRKKAISILLACLCMFFAACGSNSKKVPEAADPQVKEPAIKTGRQDGERFEGVIMLEGMEETVKYEHVKNGTIGFEMDYDYEHFVRLSEPDRDRFISCYDNPQNPVDYLEVKTSTEDADTVAASVIEVLSKDYEPSMSSFMLDHAGSCIRIDASAAKGGKVMPNLLQMVYIIPATDGCRIATAHYSIESAEGFGKRFHNMMDTLIVIQQ